MWDFINKHFLKLIHIAFWTFYYTLAVTIVLRITNNLAISFQIASTNLIGTIPLVYFFLLYLLPKYWDHKKYKTLFFGIMAATFISALIRFLLIQITIAPNSDAESFLDKYELLFQYFIAGIFLIMLTIPLRIIDVFIKKIKLESKLKTHKLEAELRFLKAQVNPHFLFNTLNNIYSLSFTQSKEAPSMILKLSEMMSFMLYDCKEEFVLLSSEILYLRNFLELQKLKQSGDQNFVLEIEGDPDKIKISPMIFIPFYENAIKHGNMEIGNCAFLYSSFKINEDTLEFKIKNSKPINKKKYDKGGVGLNNVKDRLNLLYPNKHWIQFKENDMVYEVLLNINCSKSKPDE